MRITAIREGRLRRYLLYASGEVLLIVFGVLIAFNLNNWRDNYKKNQQFEVLIEQIYNSVKIDTDMLLANMSVSEIKIEWIEELLARPDDVSDSLFLPILFFLDKYYIPEFSETRFHISLLDYNPENRHQNEITKFLSGYTENDFWKISHDSKGEYSVITTLLTAEDIPVPNLYLGLPSVYDFPSVFPGFFNQKDLSKARDLVRSRKGRAALKTLETRKNEIFISYINSLEYANSILELIRQYYPDVRLSYNNIGVIGSATGAGWSESLPMHRKQGVDGVWELKIHLFDGLLKFRNGDSWAQNWGGTEFPSGQAVFFGENIPVDEGYYSITLNLIENSYEFNTLEEK